MKLYASFLPLLLLAFWPSCDSHEEQADLLQTQINDCSAEIMCTEQLEHIKVYITDNSGEPINLDTYKITNLETGKSYVLTRESFQNEYYKGYHTLITDSQMHEVAKTGTTLEFTGSIGAKEVIRETFLVGHNCCHVTLLSGDLNRQISLK